MSTRPDPPRLVVFVHGFAGDALETWQDFEGEIGRGLESFWNDSDVLFIGYDSTGYSIDVSTALIAEYLETFLPFPSASLLVETVDNIELAVRDSAVEYSELVLVGHSLGGVIVRNIVRTVLRDKILFDVGVGDDRTGLDLNGFQELILDARVVLFAPALGGARVAGLLGTLNALGLARVVFSTSPSYAELTTNKALLNEIKSETEALYATTGGGCFSAEIAWAQHDKVVTSLNYRSDRTPRLLRSTDHLSICKPNPKYRAPVELLLSPSFEQV